MDCFLRLRLLTEFSKAQIYGVQLIRESVSHPYNSECSGVVAWRCALPQAGLLFGQSQVDAERSQIRAIFFKNTCHF
jgi:hypothetical protein